MQIGEQMLSNLRGEKETLEISMVSEYFSVELFVHSMGSLS
jgi:hypothetical protein